MRSRATEVARLPTAIWLSGRVKGPTNTSSFLRVQQGDEVAAAPDLAAAQGHGARGLWLSEKRQAGGPREHPLSFGTDALPISVVAQRVRRGSCIEQGGRMQRTLHSDQQGPRTLLGLYLTPLFQYKQSRKKVKSLWGGGGRRVVCVAWEPNPQPTGGGVGPDCQHGRGRWHQG